MDPDKEDKGWFERPKPSEMFDSSDPYFYASPEFQEVAMAVMWSALCGHVRKHIKSLQGRTNHVGAQVLANEAMYKTLTAFPKKVCDLEGTPSARREYFRRLLYKIARHLTVSFIRTIDQCEKTMKVTSMEEDLATIDRPSNRDIFQSELAIYPSQTTLEKPGKFENAFAKLSEVEQDVLRLHYCEGICYAKIGVRLGCSKGALKAIAFRARNRLRVLLRDEPEFERLFQQGGAHGR